MKKFINENKFPIILSVLFIVLVLVGYNVYKIIMPDVNQAVYGTRLEKKVEISKEDYEKVLTKIRDYHVVEKADKVERGLVITYMVVVKDETTLDEAKSISKIVLENHEEEVIKSYDIQIIVNNENKEKTNYPIIGYKNLRRDKFSWTKDRVVE